MAQLRDRMEQDLILRQLSPATRRNYLLYCRKFAAHYGRSPEELGETEIREYLLHPIQVEQVNCWERCTVEPGWCMTSPATSAAIRVAWPFPTPA